MYIFKKIFNFKKSKLVIVALLFLSPLVFAKFTVPPIKGPVNDLAGILPTKTESSLNNLLIELKKLKSSEIAILTVPDLGEETIEQASIQVTDQWQLGTEKNDNGLLLMIAMKERKMRIEIGQGFEGDLTDSEAAAIIFQTMIPLMKTGDSKSAVIAGLYKIIQQAYPDLNVEDFFKKHLRFVPKSSNPAPDKTQFIILIIIFLLIIYFNRNSRGPGGGFHSGGGFGSNGGLSSGGFGGGSNGSGGGFGGFGGGGGGFSGGGASGGW